MCKLLLSPLIQRHEAVNNLFIIIAKKIQYKYHGMHVKYSGLTKKHKGIVRFDIIIKQERRCSNITVL